MRAMESTLKAKVEKANGAVEGCAKFLGSGIYAKTLC
jgi:hypothetical protein